ncbi:HEPN domain-containing protein [Thermococcus profundus]|uniref:HEPN domain-containing protein n=1 Tax=Thermococcus profundus TaxID=49899 RepID=UPI002689CA07
MINYPAIIHKAEESLEAAKALLEKGAYEFAVSRAYYTMFYCAEAILLTKGISVSKHSAVIALLGKELVKTGEIPYKFFTYLRLAFQLRPVADYSFETHLSEKTPAPKSKGQRSFWTSRAHT